MQATEAAPAVRRKLRQGVSWGLVRHVGTEILKTSLFVLLVLELCYSLLVAVAVARNFDLDLPLALPVMWFTALSMLNDSIPLALLFATALVFGRFIADREIMAQKSFGMSHKQILAPVIVIASFFCVTGYFLNAYLVPHMKHQKRNVGALLIQQFRSLGKGYNRDFRFGNVNLWIKEHDGRQLEGIFLAPRTGTDGDDGILGAEKLSGIDPIAYPLCIYAERGRVLFPGEIEQEMLAGGGDRGERASDPLPTGFPAEEIDLRADPPKAEEGSGEQIIIELEGLSLFWTDELHPGGTHTFLQRASVGRYYVPFDPAGSKRRDPGRKELSSPKLLAAIARTEEKAENPDLTDKQRGQWQGQLARMRTEYHDRWARMFAYFLFPLLAGLIALFLNSQNRLLPFFVSVGTIPAVYYGSATIGQMLGQSGAPAWLVMQLGNMILVGAGGFLLFRLERRMAK